MTVDLKAAADCFGVHELSGPWLLPDGRGNTHSVTVETTNVVCWSLNIKADRNTTTFLIPVPEYTNLWKAIKEESNEWTRFKKGTRILQPIWTFCKDVRDWCAATYERQGKAQRLIILNYVYDCLCT